MFIICVGKHGRLQTMDPGREMKVRRAISRAAEWHKRNQLLMQVVEQIIIHPESHSCLLLFDVGNGKYYLLPKEKVSQK